MAKKSELQRNVLTPNERERLKEARKRAMRGKPKFTVEFSRSYYRLHDPATRRLARFEEAEAAVFRLCSDKDRRGNFAGDRRMAELLIQLLADVFNVEVR